MSEKKGKTAEQVAGLLTKFATGLQAHVEDHPALEPLIGQINRKAESLLRPAKPAKPVQLSYSDGNIIINDTPFLHRKAFGAWRFKLAEAKGEVTGTRTSEETGEELNVYASTYDKELGKNVIPESRKEQLMEVIKSFFPNSPIEEV